MSARATTTRVALSLALVLAASATTGCSPVDPDTETNGTDVTTSSDEQREPAVEQAVAATTENISGVWATRERSGLGENLYVSIEIRSDSLSAEELESVLRAIAPLTPEATGVVTIAASTESGEIVSLTEAGAALQLPDLNTRSSSGEVTIKAVALKRLFAG